jgi:hypothetical protein
MSSSIRIGHRKLRMGENNGLNRYPKILRLHCSELFYTHETYSMHGQIKGGEVRPF